MLTLQVLLSSPRILISDTFSEICVLMNRRAYVGLCAYRAADRELQKPT